MPTKKKSKKSGASILVVGGVVAAVAAVLLWPKKASAAPTPTPGGGGTKPAAGDPLASHPHIVVLSEGDGPTDGSGAIPPFAKPTAGDKAAFYLEGIDASGNPVLTPAGTLEPVVGDIANIADAKNLPLLVQNLRTDKDANGVLVSTYYFGSALPALLATGNVVMWTANPDGTINHWWLTKWS